MARVPLLGRLLPAEYIALFGSLILVLLEWVIHVIADFLRECLVYSTGGISVEVY